MDTLQAIQSRRSIKHYDPDYKISDEDLRKILSHAMLSPTAFNLQHWRFLVVDDPEMRKKIRAYAWDQAQVTEASRLVILCGDLKAWNKDVSRYWVNAPKDVQKIIVPAAQDYYENNPQAERDEVMRSCALAGQSIMIAATALGYDTCPMDGFDFEKVAKLVGLPEDHIISFMIVIGKGIKAAWDRPGQLSYDDVVIKNHF